MLFVTLDGPLNARIGWLFVTGGSQTRVGPHRLYERLATKLVGAGHAVVRFDRRGLGDSEGEDHGYLGSGPEIMTALALLRSEWPLLDHALGFGLCDGATALALHGAGTGLDRLVLANPWTVEAGDDLPPPAAIRGHYRRRLADPRAWLRLLTGRVDPLKLLRGLSRSRTREEDGLARRLAAGIGRLPRIVLAEGDGTAQAFSAAWKQIGRAAPAIETIRISTTSHSFADPAAFEALAAALLGAVTPPR